VIVVDTSALVAIISLESDWTDLLRTIREARTAFISPINYVETGIVMVTRRHVRDARELDQWLETLRIKVRDDVPLGTAALQAYLAYGNGVHPARLNLADTFAYALAKALDAPLLYKGNGFALTDVRSAFQPT
jgi:ribonuclease VapC